EINSFHQELLETNDDFVCQKKNISGNNTPQFDKSEITHLVWKEVRYLNIIENLIKKSSTKVIGIVRHPCGVLKSWMKAPKEFDSAWRIEEEWRHAAKKNSGDHEFYGYERWLQAARMFKKLEKTYPEQFKVVTYEGLLDNLAGRIASLFDFTGITMTKQTQHFLEESTTQSSDDPYSVFRKDKRGDEWKNELPMKVIDEIINDPRYINLKSK